MIPPRFVATLTLTLLGSTLIPARAQTPSAAARPIVVRAARLLDVETGRMLAPGEVLVQGERIVEVGSSVRRPPNAEIIDLGDRTLLPGLIDTHVHLFLHPGAEDLQTVQESVPKNESR